MSQNEAQAGDAAIVHNYGPVSPEVAKEVKRMSASSEEAMEQARAFAFNAHLDGMHFHEVAMRDPFEAEREYQALAKKIIDLLGPPEGVRIVEYKP